MLQFRCTECSITAYCNERNVAIRGILKRTELQSVCWGNCWTGKLGPDWSDQLNVCTGLFSILRPAQCLHWSIFHSWSNQFPTSCCTSMNKNFAPSVSGIWKIIGNNTLISKICWMFPIIEGWNLLLAAQTLGVLIIQWNAENTTSPESLVFVASRRLPFVFYTQLFGSAWIKFLLGHGFPVSWVSTI